MRALGMMMGEKLCAVGLGVFALRTVTKGGGEGVFSTTNPRSTYLLCTSQQDLQFWE